MFVCLDNKLYIRKGEKIVGINYSFAGVEEVEGTELDFSPQHLILTPYEAKAKFHVTKDSGYKFPLSKTKTLPVDEKIEVKEVKAEVKVEAKTKPKSTRKK